MSKTPEYIENEALEKAGAALIRAQLPGISGAAALQAALAAYRRACWQEISDRHDMPKDDGMSILVWTPGLPDWVQRVSVLTAWDGRTGGLWQKDGYTHWRYIETPEVGS